MRLSAYFHAAHIPLFASLPVQTVPVTKPRLLTRIPGACSVIFCAIPYYAAGEAGANLAMFARGRDYHALAEELTVGAAACLSERHPGCGVAGFADHSPFAEAAGAAMAGLGVLGDHGLLITDRFSSYVFVYEIVTTLTLSELEAEGIPLGCGEIRYCEHCGACTKACPGGCRNSDRTLCLSAISQKKGTLSAAEEGLLRDAPYAWGCDVCQEACPHTARAAEAGTLGEAHPYFAEDRILQITPAMLEAMDDAEYRRYAFGWRSKAVMERNLALQGE